VSDRRADLTSAAKERLAALRRQSFEQLSALPESTTEPYPVRGKRVDLSTWRDVLPSGELRIVVQLYQHGRLGMGRIFATGFAVNGRGETRELPREELAPFS
jgi:hypothetical protein